MLVRYTIKGRGDDGKKYCITNRDGEFNLDPDRGHKRFYVDERSENKLRGILESLKSKVIVSSDTGVKIRELKLIESRGSGSLLKTQLSCPSCNKDTLNTYREGKNMDAQKFIYAERCNNCLYSNVKLSKE